MLRWFAYVTLLVCVPCAVQAGGKEAPPTMRLQIRSLDAVIDNVKLLVSLAGREEIAKQVEALIKTKIGNKGLEGIDPARPFGAYSKFGKELNDVSGVVLVPIVDETAFLALLGNLNIQAEKNDKTGIYTIKSGAPVAVFMRFANKYAYFTALNLEALETKTILPPDAVFRANSQAAITASLQLDQLPEAIKFIAKAQFEQGLQEAQDKKVAGETKAQKDFRLQLSREIVENVAALFTDGQELNIDFHIDKTSKEMSVTLAISALGKTGLAKQIQEMSKNKDLFGNLRTKDAAAQGAIAVVMPKTLRKSFDAIIDEARTKILGDVRDPAKKKQAENLLNVLAPTFKAGELDAALSLRGPSKDKHYTVIAAVKVQQGDELNKILRELVEDVIKQMPASERSKIQLDVEMVAGTKIHRFDLGNLYDAKIRDIFGESPAFIAIRNDAVFYAVGPDGQKVLKGALSAKGDSAANPLAFEVSLARLAPLMAKTASQQEKVAALFPAGDEGTIRFTVEGGANLRVRFSTRLSVVQFIAAMSTLRQAN